MHVNASVRIGAGLYLAVPLNALEVKVHCEADFLAFDCVLALAAHLKPGEVEVLFKEPQFATGFTIYRI